MIFSVPIFLVMICSTYEFSYGIFYGKLKMLSCLRLWDRILFILEDCFIGEDYALFNPELRRLIKGFGEDSGFRFWPFETEGVLLY